MKLLLVTLLTASTSLLVGCNNTNRDFLVETNNTPGVEQNKSHDGVENKSERVYEFEIEFDGEDLPAGIQEMIEQYAGQDGDADVHVVVNGEVVGDLSGEMPMRFTYMMGGEENPEMMLGGPGGDMHDMDPEIREHIMEMMRQGFHVPEGMNPLDAHRRNDDRGEGGPPQEMRDRMMRDHEGGDWEREFRHNISEEQEFMDKVRMYYEVAAHLAESQAVALLGIHMIRDQVEPEMRLEILEEIIDSTEDGSSSRNAAILVTIETLRELDQQDDAAEYMAELVISNTMNWDGGYEDEDDYEDGDDD